MASTTDYQADSSGRSEPALVTIGHLRQLLENLPDETPLVVGVRGRHHFNALVGQLSVQHAEIFPGPKHPIVVLDVAGIS